MDPRMYNCPRCASRSLIKNGSVNGLRKKKCKACGYQFTRLLLRNTPFSVRLHIVFQYIQGLSPGEISNFTGFSIPTITKWIANFEERYKFNDHELVEFETREKLVNLKLDLNFKTKNYLEYLQKSIDDVIKKNVECSEIEKSYLKVNNNKVLLSKRQRECLTLLSIGKTIKETAKLLSISPRTVESYLGNIKMKSGITEKSKLLDAFWQKNTYD